MNKLKQNFGKRETHEVRVEIKKIKAFYRLLQNIAPREFDAKRYARPFRKVFKHAGTLRETQINADYIDAYSLTKETKESYIRFLHKCKRKARTSLQKQVKKFDKKELKQLSKQVSAVCTQLDKINIGSASHRYFLREAGKIEKLLHSEISTEKLHEIRKGLKHLKEMVPIIQATSAGLLHKSLPSTLKQAETLIGKWHDRTMLIESLKTYIQLNNLDPAGRNEIQKAIIAIRLQNKAQVPPLKRNLNDTLALCLRTT